jgi:hypothetical protein
MADYTTSHQVITAFFDSRAQAEAAVERVLAAGIQTSQVRMVEGRAGDVTGTAEPKGFFEALADFFLPDDDRSAYAEGLSRGGFVVSANVDATARDRILDILDDEGTVDMDLREQSWRDEGWAPPADVPRRSAADQRAAAGGADDEGVPIDVAEELLVSRRDVEHGRPRVRTYVTGSPEQDEARTVEMTGMGEEGVVSSDARLAEDTSPTGEFRERDEIERETIGEGEDDGRMNGTDLRR